LNKSPISYNENPKRNYFYFLEPDYLYSFSIEREYNFMGNEFKQLQEHYEKLLKNQKRNFEIENEENIKMALLKQKKDYDNEKEEIVRAIEDKRNELQNEYEENIRIIENEKKK
jgi:hypothetical protein